MKRAKTKPPRRGRKKPTLLFYMALSTTLSLALTMLLIVMSYRLVLNNYYLHSLQDQLLSSLQRLQNSDFSEEALARLRQNDVAVLLVDSGDHSIVYEDMYFLNDEPRHEKPHNGRPEGEAEFPHADEREAMPHPIVERLIEHVNSNVTSTAGHYFSNASLEQREQNLMESGLLSNAIYLNGRQEQYYFSLCLPVESISTSLNLATRFATGIALTVLVLSLLVVYLFYRRITRPAKEVAKTADQISQLDFCSRCPPANTREITEISESVNRMSDQLQAYVTRLEQSNQLLAGELDERKRQSTLMRELIGNLSHDLKTPIAIISGYAEGLSEGIADTEDTRTRYLNTILQESEHMQNIVSKLLSISRLEAGVDPIVRSCFDLSKLAASVCDSFAHEIEKNGLQLDLQLETPLPVYSDFERIHQVVTNYLQNSVYHINNGNQIRLITEHVGDRAIFRIANSSAPIPDEVSDRLWEKLFRGDYARRRNRGEAGLGLSIVRQNMEQLGHAYGFRNCEADGMVEFYMELPTAKAAEPNDTGEDHTEWNESE